MIKALRIVFPGRGQGVCFRTYTRDPAQFPGAAELDTSSLPGVIYSVIVPDADSEPVGFVVLR